jgi:hypothetical protein
VSITKCDRASSIMRRPWHTGVVAPHTKRDRLLCRGYSNGILTVYGAARYSTGGCNETPQKLHSVQPATIVQGISLLFQTMFGGRGIVLCLFNLKLLDTRFTYL